MFLVHSRRKAEGENVNNRQAWTSGQQSAVLTKISSESIVEKFWILQFCVTCIVTSLWDYSVGSGISTEVSYKHNNSTIIQYSISEPTCCIILWLILLAQTMFLIYSSSLLKRRKTLTIRSRCQAVRTVRKVVVFLPMIYLKSIVAPTTANRSILFQVTLTNISFPESGQEERSAIPWNELPIVERVGLNRWWNGMFDCLSCRLEYIIMIIWSDWAFHWFVPSFLSVSQCWDVRGRGGGKAIY